MAPRIVTSKSGNSFAATSEAEYTLAPASFTIVYSTDNDVSLNTFATNSSVSLLAVPLPIDMALILNLLIISITFFLLPS